MGFCEGRGTQSRDIIQGNISRYFQLLHGPSFDG